MKTDRGLLELAAKSAGVKGIYRSLEKDFAGNFQEGFSEHYAYRWWNPLTDDGDALRLAVKVLNWPHGGRAFDNAVTAMYAVGQLPKDPYAATRRAIVRAAAAIGETL